jgi:hydroxymethylpyrimidine pyrophosphatase-like HAD family hydrolase
VGGEPDDYHLSLTRVELPTDRSRTDLESVPAMRDVAGTAGEPALANLLNDLDGLTGHLLHAVAGQRWVDAFLFAAGLNQIVEDDLHGDKISLSRVARHVNRLFKGPLGAAAAAGVRTADAARWRYRTLPTSDRSSLDWQRRVAALCDQLADAMVSAPERAQARQLLMSAQALAAGSRRLPSRLKRSVVRVPSCFRTFDQQPADLERLTEEFSLRWPDRDLPLVVVGLRTSGSYTAPLHGAFLRARGYRQVQVLTSRPGQRWRGGELRVLRSVIGQNGLALVTDDPPKSGRSLAGAAHELERLGFPSASVVLLLQTLEGMRSLPEVLQPYPSIVRAWEEWTVQANLEPQAIRETLSQLLGPAAAVGAVRRLPATANSSRRTHVRALYRVALTDRSHPAGRPRDVYVKGVGFGYFGDQSVAVGRQLKEFVPEVFGVRNGLVFREWLPERSRLGEVEPTRAHELAAGIVDYATQRARTLAVAEDMSLRLVDRGAVWQRSSDVLGRAFGRGGQLMRPVLHRLVKRLLRVDEPSVIDGSMGLSNWFQPADGEAPLCKVDFYQQAFSSLDIYCYDHAFDLAGCAVPGSDPAFSDELRGTYLQKMGHPIDAERWLLYRLVHTAELERDSTLELPGVEDAFGQELMNYYRETVFADVGFDQVGPLCGIDIDWVLETRTMGFTSISPAGAVALRALARHGFRPVLVTGRSLDEVRRRCHAYSLVGGVAEYGAATYDHRTGEVRLLLSAGERADMDRLRKALSADNGVELDGGYREAIRAYRFSARGHRRSLLPETIESALKSTGLSGKVRAIQGSYQTDFMVASINKGVGLRVLADSLGVHEDANGKLLEVAVGDSAEDLPMLQLARLAIAPANADAAVRASGIRIVNRRGPAGLAQAIAKLIGHRPGSCPDCRLSHLPARSRLLLSAFGAQDSRRLGKLVHVSRLVVQLIASRHED